MEQWELSTVSTMQQTWSFKNQTVMHQQHAILRRKLPLCQFVLLASSPTLCLISTIAHRHSWNYWCNSFLFFFSVLGLSSCRHLTRWYWWNWLSSPGPPLIPRTFLQGGSLGASAVSVASLCMGQDCRTCSGVCGPVSHGLSTVCDRPRRYRWARSQAVSSL